MWRPYLMVGLSGLFFIGELVASHLAQSLILMMDSYHMLYNLMTILLFVVSYKMSKKKPSSNTFGWARLDVLGILVNILFFSALCFAVIVEGIQGLLHVGHQGARPTYPFLVLACGASRLAINALAWILIGGYTKQQHPFMEDNGSQDLSTVKCNTSTDYTGYSMTDILRDNSGCLLVICCGCLVYFLDEYVPPYVDLVFSLLAVIIIIITSYHFVKESGLILLQTIPDNMDVESLKHRLIKQFPAILNIHDIHVWRLNSSQTIATVHVVLPSVSFYISINNDLEMFFKKEGITTVTIQPEFSHGNNLQISECYLKCSSSYNCGALTCCGELLKTSCDSDVKTTQQTKVNQPFSYPVEIFMDDGLILSDTTRC